MTLNLISLIRAGYNREAPGQGFRAYAPGSPVTGTKLSDYVLGTMSMTGTLIDSYDGSEFSIIPSGGTHTMTASFASLGSKFTTIRSDVINNMPGWYFFTQSGETQQVQLIINSVSWSGLTATVSVTVQGIFRDGTFQSISTFGAVVTGADFPQNSVSYRPIRFEPNYTTPTPTGSATSVATMNFKYMPDVGGFNIVKELGPYSRNFAKQNYPAGNLTSEYRLYGNSSVNPNVTPNASEVAQQYDVAQGTSVTVYAWYRNLAAYSQDQTWIPYTLPSQGSPSPITFEYF